jgi:hypothetical protein
LHSGISRIDLLVALRFAAFGAQSPAFLHAGPGSFNGLQELNGLIEEPKSLRGCQRNKLAQFSLFMIRPLMDRHLIMLAVGEFIRHRQVPDY